MFREPLPADRRRIIHMAGHPDLRDHRRGRHLRPHVPYRCLLLLVQKEKTEA